MSRCFSPTQILFSTSLLSKYPIAKNPLPKAAGFFCVRGSGMIVYVSRRMCATGYRLPLSLRGAATKGGDVAISWYHVLACTAEWMIVPGDCHGRCRSLAMTVVFDTWPHTSNSTDKRPFTDTKKTRLPQVRQPLVYQGMKFSKMGSQPSLTAVSYSSLVRRVQETPWIP